MMEARSMIAEDFRDFEKSFFHAVEQKNMSDLRKALHKVEPIIKNLNFIPLVMLLEDYRKEDAIHSSFEALNSKLRYWLHKLYQALE